MTTFLEKIVETKQREVETLRRSRTQFDEGKRNASTRRRSFADAIRRQSKLAIVAEVKKASPSKGLIAADFQPVEIAKTYASGGACAISVLTDQTFFQGSLEDLIRVRENVAIPVLRKDFMIDELQIDEALAAGADAVLLICAAMSSSRLFDLSAYAATLGLDVLIEVHKESEIDSALAAKPSVIGINNRDLHTFEVSLAVTERILRQLPKEVLVIAESGIHSPEDAIRMAESGAHGILVGESLMRAGTPERVVELMHRFQVPLLERSESSVVNP